MRKSFPKTARLLALAMLVAGPIAGCSSSQNIAASEAAATSPAGSVISDPRVNALVMNSCYGCHSNEGSPPWYATIAPSYWSDRSGARGALNFSDWQTYDAQRKGAEIRAIAAVVSTGSMPPGDYTFFDSSARLTDDQKRVVAQWAAEQSALSAH
jgi:mono/diheme cytochrome c family protein